MLLPPNVQPIAGKLWIPAAGFEQHLYAELRTASVLRTNTAVKTDSGAEAKPLESAEAAPDSVLSPEQAAAFFSVASSCPSNVCRGGSAVPFNGSTAASGAAMRSADSPQARIEDTAQSIVYAITGAAQESNLQNTDSRNSNRQKNRRRNTALSPLTGSSAASSTALHRLVYSSTPPAAAFWAQLCFEQPFTAQFSSISEAAGILRCIQRNWVHYPLSHFRRASLVTERLPYINSKPRTFPSPLPLTDIGVWSLLDAHTLIASAKTSSPLPLGRATFCEDHENPPSRAYLKLWEALTLLDYYYRKAQADHTAPLPADWALPQQGSRCIDAGACPGGWTWVLRELGSSVTAIDRAPLAEALMHDPAVTFLKHDAFTLSPAALGTQDWVCSDVICYPPRLLDWVTQWLQSGLCQKFICTIKMQGSPDTETISRFAAIPHSKILHLSANKHELTWLCAPFIR